MKLSKRTKKARTISIIFCILHFLCIFAPLAYYVPYGFITGETKEKVVMSFSIIFSIVLAVISIVVDVRTRAGLQKTMLWGLILGVMICLEQAKDFIVIMAIVSIVDELIITHIQEHYANVYKTNKEIDRRFE